MKTTTMTRAQLQEAPKPKPLSFGQRERLRLRRDFTPLVDWIAANRVSGFYFPMPPNKANGRGHWRVEKGLRDLYFEQCDQLVTYGLLPRKPHTPFLCTSIRAELVLKSTMDFDNLMARLKFPVDWLVKRGYLLDDKPANLVWEGVPTQSKTAGSVQRVHIVLTPGRIA